jgi:hypothetical protein
LDQILPDSLFACPKESAGDNLTTLSNASMEANDNTSTPSSTSNNNQLLPSASPLTMASLKNVFANCPGTYWLISLLLYGPKKKIKNFIVTVIFIFQVFFWAWNVVDRLGTWPARGVSMC